MERLKKIVKLPHRLRPAQSSKVSLLNASMLNKSVHTLYRLLSVHTDKHRVSLGVCTLPGASLDVRTTAFTVHYRECGFRSGKRQWTV